MTRSTRLPITANTAAWFASRRLSLAVALFCGLLCPAGAQSAADLPRTGGTETSADDEAPATGSARLALAAPPYPAAVERLLERRRRDCRSRGGADATFRPGTVRAGDLTGLGQRDFIIDYRQAYCADDLGLFSGTGGWDLEIVVTTRSGRLVRVFDGRVLDYDISPRGAGGRTMTFRLHGAFCGRVGTDLCVKRHRISGRRFSFRE